MDSNEINRRISALDEQDLPFEAFGGKAIPYVGWFWRRVDFDTEDHSFGVIAGCNECSAAPIVGFMENNKWGYDYVFADKPQWANIKALIVTALEDLTADNLTAVNGAIQGLIAGEHRHYSRGGW